MSLAFDVFSQPSRLRALLDHFSRIEDPRDPRRVAHPLPEALLLVVRGTMADCDDYESIAAWVRHRPIIRALDLLKRYANSKLQTFRYRHERHAAGSQSSNLG